MTPNRPNQEWASSYRCYTIAHLESEQEALMAERMVKCVKLQRELPGLDKPPFSDALGQKIYENVSKEGWRMFKEHFKMVMNEYRLALGTDEANRIFEQQVEEYFFGPGSTLPPGYIPPRTQQH